MPNDVASMLGVPELDAPPPQPAPAAPAAAPSIPPLPNESDAGLLARAAVAEGDQNNPESWKNVAGVILNRAQKSGRSVADVLSEPGQFEAYGNGHIQAVDPNSPAYKSALATVQGVKAGDVPYDSFYQPQIVAQRGVKPPFDPKTGTQIGTQLFGTGGYTPQPQGGQLADALGLSPEERAALQIGPQPASPEAETPGPKAEFNFGPQMSAMSQAAVARFHALANDPNRGIDPNASAGSPKLPYYVTPGTPVPQTAGIHWVDANGQEHVNPGGALENAGAAVQGAFQGMFPDVGASLTRLTGGAFGVGTPQQAEQAAQAQQRRYAIEHLGDQFAQAGRFAGQAVPATAAALAVPEIEAPAAAGTVGRIAATGLTNALRGVAATAPSVGASSAPVAQQLATGALAGVAAPLVTGAIGKPATALSRALAPPGPEDRVASILQTALARDSINPAAAATEAVTNPARPAFHAGGPNVTALADSVSQSPGPGQSILRGAVAQHQAEAPDQVRAAINTALGGKGDYLATLDQTIAQRREMANGTMTAIQDSPVALSDNSITALRSGLAKGAISAAAQNALASPDAASRATGAALNRIATDALDNPSAIQLTVRNAQDISRSLLDAADGAFRSGDNARGIALKTLGRSVRDDAATSSPTYQAWLKRYGSDSDNLDALQLGHNVFSQAQGNTAAQVQKTLAGMGDAAGDYYRKGVAEALIDQSRTAKGGIGTMRQLLRTQDLSDKVRLAFPDDASFNSFIDTVQQQVGEQNTNTHILGGSPTYARQAARADLQAQPFHPLDALAGAADIGGNILTGQIGTLARKGFSAVRNLPRTDNSVLGNPQTNALLGVALSDPETFSALVSRTPRASAPTRALQGIGAGIKPVEIPLSALAGLRLPGAGQRNPTPAGAK